MKRQLHLISWDPRGMQDAMLSNLSQPAMDEGGGWVTYGHPVNGKSTYK